MNWLKKQFGWMFTQGNGSKSRVGTAYIYGEGEIPQWALLGEYDNGRAIGKGRTEYIWLPTETATPSPSGYIETASSCDPHGSPRHTAPDDRPGQQAGVAVALLGFGQAKPTGVLKATPNPKAAITNQPELLKATNPQQELNFGFPGWYRDAQTNTFYNHQRDAVSARAGPVLPDRSDWDARWA